MGFHGGFIGDLEINTAMKRDNDNPRPLPVEALLQWYRENRRDLPWRGTRDIYAVWVSEVMLQQTQVSTVIPYFQRFMERFPTVRDLAEGTEQDVLKVWEGLGYYSRVRNLHKAAQQVMTQFGGEIPEDPAVFRKMPGVGPYIGAAVLSIARDIPMAAVDGNVLRVMTRFRAIGDDIRKTAVRNNVARQLETVIPPGSSGDFTQALMELGALVCLPRSPRCGRCPLRPGCTAFSKGTIDKYPVKTIAKTSPLYRVSVAIILKSHSFYIQKRPSEGHLGGLWEFPGGKAEGVESAEHALVRECREELNCDVEIIETLPLVRHVYSHFKIELTPFICCVKKGTVTPEPGREFRWITVDQLDDYPFPGANHKFFPHLKAFLKR